MRLNIQKVFAFSVCILWVWLAVGCERNPGPKKQSPALKVERGADVEELRQRAQETDRNPPSESEDRTVAALWASISEMAPPAGFMGRDSLDRGVAEQNLVFAASEIALAVQEAGFEDKIPVAIIRGAVEAAVHHLSREEREKLKAWEAPVRLTAVACFLMTSHLIGRECGYDQTDMYPQRMNLQVRLEGEQLILKTKMPGGSRQAWPQSWLRLFTACFHRPLVILPTDSLRRELWKWIDQKPSIAIQARDGSVLAAGTLAVPGPK